jgi:phenylacetate-coenzyme A ligase PaaK-like adenylate-forming protein
MQSLRDPDTVTWQDYRDAISADGEAALAEHVTRLKADASTIAELQEAGLRRLLSHAIAHSAFHRDRLSAMDLDSVTPADMSALPVMTKDQMMAALDDVFTDPRLTRDRVETALAETDEHPVPIDGEFVSLATGGSSGRRASISFDRAGLIGYLSCLARPMAARLQEVAGGGPLPTLTLAMVAAASAKHATNAMSHFATGSLPFRFEHVPATLPLAEIVARLNALQPPALMGYSSVVHRLAMEQRAGRLQIAPLSISAMSETLDDSMREVITDAFGVAPVNTFGSTEGLVGASPPGGEAIVFNTDVCIVELVDDDYQPVPVGTQSSRILLTNLYNLAQPLIRYEITDRFQQVVDPNGGGLLHAIVHGRQEDPLRYGATEVHPHAITTVMVAAPDVADYQVRQTATGIHLTVVAEADFGETRLADALTASLVRAGLADATVDISRVDQLARDEKTGKVRRFVPLS